MEKEMEEEIDLKTDMENHIKKLEAEKAKLIEKITKLNSRLKYKQYELKALQPFLEQTKDVKIAPLRRKLRNLEFKISTQAYTPKIEKELIKKVKKVEADLAKVADVEKARRKKKLVEGDIAKIKSEIAQIEGELKKIREELKEYYESIREQKKRQNKKDIKNDHMVTLEDIVVFEKEEK